MELATESGAEIQKEWKLRIASGQALPVARVCSPVFRPFLMGSGTLDGLIDRRGYRLEAAALYVLFRADTQLFRRGGLPCVRG
ncbi:MAG: hypothetical protein VB858_09745 [Planctomycetaceae bacterium]